jgi:hypothetical protein
MIKRLALLAMVSLPLLLQAQNAKWQIYPSLGIDMGGAVPFPLSDIPEGSKGTPKLSPDLGLGFGYTISGRVDLDFEVNYHILAFSASADVRSQPFYYDDHQDVIYFSGHTNTDVELRFLEFPLLAVYNFSPAWSFTPGLYYSRILEGSFNTKSSNGVISPDKSITDAATLPGIANTSYNFNDFIDNWDAGMILGFRYNLNHKLFFWSRMQVGFKSIFKKDFDNIEYELYQVRLNVGVSVNLFGK